MHLIFLLIQILLSVDSTIQKNTIFFYDKFQNLNNWESFQFSSGKKPTEYKIISENIKKILEINSNFSASGLICKYKFNPKQYPLLKWKWKVNNIIPIADSKSKKGDDYPIRIFIMFEKDSSEISFWEKLRNAVIKLVSGYNPPYKSLCYVWANSETDTSNYFSPYTEDVMIVSKQFGFSKCNQWIAEQVNIIVDYKNYFEEEIPTNACIAIMADTDNTESQTLAYLEYMELKMED
jgi:hypothetical protein